VVINMARALSKSTRLLLYGEPWETYVRLLHIFEERRHLRITYDRGALEIMTLSPEHEHLKKLLARLVETLAEELNQPLEAYGSMTFKRRAKLRGLEPDDCYWIQNEARVRNLQKRFNPRRDPPPDLSVEVEVSRSAVNRMEIYRTMKVPEVWRHDGKDLQFHILGPAGYSISLTSRAFPMVKSTDFAPFLAMLGQTDLISITRQFRAWVQARIAAGWQ
jgi:Uma2 family endonuclease